jgi:hypothetical protein
VGVQASFGQAGDFEYLLDFPPTLAGKQFVLWLSGSAVVDDVVNPFVKVGEVFPCTTDGEGGFRSPVVAN